jgi:hypothetical protein
MNMLRPVLARFASRGLVAGLVATIIPVGAALAARQSESQTAAVDFVAVTRDGQPVLDLTADEVVLRIDGKVRPIRSLEFVRFAVSGGAALADVRSAPAFLTNAPAEAPRSFVLVVDDESMPIGQEKRLREALGQFADGLPSSDRVALVTVPNGGVKVDLTADRGRLRRGIAEISPISSVLDPHCRAGSTLTALQTTFETIARSTSHPVIVLFFSSTMVGPSQLEAAQRPNATTGAGGLSTAGGACYLRADDFRRLGDAAAAARVQFYVIHPDYNPGPPGVGIENLRGATGAPVFHLAATGPEAGLPRIARETAGYYLVTFATETGERLDSAHQMNVRVNRRDVEVRARPTLVFSKSMKPATVEAAPTFTSAFEVVRSGRIFREVPLRATTSASRGADGAVNVVTLFESVDPATSIASAAAALFDDSGRGVAYWTGTAKDLTTRPAVIGMAAAPGRYRLRVGVIDGSGKSGVNDAPITAELVPAGSLQLGGLSLGVSRSGGFQPRLQFTTEASALAHVEVYGGAAGTRVSVAFEVAETTDGAPLFRVPGVLSPSSDPDRYSATGTITVGILPPGDYVIRAIIGVEGQPAGRVVRTLHKSG